MQLATLATSPSYHQPPHSNPETSGEVDEDYECGGARNTKRGCLGEEREGWRVGDNVELHIGENPGHEGALRQNFYSRNHTS